MPSCVPDKELPALRTRGGKDGPSTEVGGPGTSLHQGGECGHRTYLGDTWGLATSATYSDFVQT